MNAARRRMRRVCDAMLAAAGDNARLGEVRKDQTMLLVNGDVLTVRRYSSKRYNVFVDVATESLVLSGFNRMRRLPGVERRKFAQIRMSDETTDGELASQAKVLLMELKLMER